MSPEWNYFLRHLLRIEATPEMYTSVVRCDEKIHRKGSKKAWGNAKKSEIFLGSLCSALRTIRAEDGRLIN
jgi:hypothetical protein